MINTIEQAGGKDWIYSHRGACTCNRGWDDLEANRLCLNAQGLCEDCHAFIIEELSAIPGDEKCTCTECDCPLAKFPRMETCITCSCGWHSINKREAVSYVMGVKAGNA
jgi:hypothetical protein